MPRFDTHIHLFPERLFEAIRSWFDRNAWPVSHRLSVGSILDTLRAHDVTRAVALCYAHRPGIAEGLNAYMAETAARHPMVVPFGTVFPGEPGAVDIVRRALGAQGLRGIKIHCHVQQIAPDDEALVPVCEAVRELDAVLLIHAGTAPALPPMRERVAAITGAARTRRLLRRFPGMKVIVPHLGMDEYRAFRELLDEFPALYLDTTMAVGGYFRGQPPVEELEPIADRVLFGTDFPNLPYPYRRELDALCSSGLTATARERILWRNASGLFGLTP
jgi:predicted TIM-barrel fold metal-dependent hydrolase